METKNYLNKDKILRFFYTVITGLLGGYLFDSLNLPLPWVLGPMIFTVILTLVFKEAYLPEYCKLFGFVILGIKMGSYFVPEMGALILNQFKFVIIMSLVTLFLGIFNGFIYKRIFNLNWMTAIFGSIPGGLSQMVEIGRELGGRPEVIAIQQTLRIVLVVIIIPSVLLFSSDLRTSPVEASGTGAEFFSIGLALLMGFGICGVVLGKVLKIPIPYMTGPLAIVSIISLSGFSLVEMPPFLLHIAQLFIGVSIGTNFKKSNLFEYRRYLLLGLFSGLSLTAMSFAAAFLLKSWAKIDLPTAILSTAPGGVAEMSITAVSIGANIPLVAAFQVFRMLLCVVFVPKLIFIFFKRSVSENEKKTS